MKSGQLIALLLVGAALYWWYTSGKKSKKSGQSGNSDQSGQSGQSSGSGSDTGDDTPTSSGDPSQRCAATGGHYSVAFATDGGYTQYWQCGGCDQDSSAEKCIEGCKKNTKNCGACQYTNSTATCYPSATNTDKENCHVIDWSKFNATITCTTKPSGYVSPAVLKKLKSVKYVNA